MKPKCNFTLGNVNANPSHLFFIANHQKTIFALLEEQITGRAFVEAFELSLECPETSSQGILIRIAFELQGVRPPNADMWITLSQFDASAFKVNICNIVQVVGFGEIPGYLAKAILEFVDYCWREHLAARIAA